MRPITRAVFLLLLAVPALARAAGSLAGRQLANAPAEACPTGHFFDASAGECAPCHTSCEACSEADACDRCQPELGFLSPVPGQRSLCTRLCPPGQVLDMATAGRCTACDAKCELCAEAPDQCTACAPGFSWHDGRAPSPGTTGTCAACPAGCHTCSLDPNQGTRCFSCMAGWLLHWQGTCEVACPDGTFALPGDAACRHCPPQCVTCTGPNPDDCSSCQEGLRPGPPGTCQHDCPIRTYPIDDGDDSAASATCLDCSSSCLTCHGPGHDQCLSCKTSSEYLVEGQCLANCPPRHFIQAGRCLPCHPGCLECQGPGPGDCFQNRCPTALFSLPTPGSQLVACVPSCPTGTLAHFDRCLPCPEHCLSCHDPYASKPTCDICAPGWLLAPNRLSCVASCPAGSLPQGPQCLVCSEGCASCFGPMPAQCLACLSDYPLVVDGECRKTCPARLFPQAGTCLPCHAGCFSCSAGGPNDCHNCENDLAHTVEGACMMDCPAGQYEDTWSEWASRTCYPCPGEGCAECTSATECTRCADALVLTGQGLCASACPTGEYLPPGAGACLPCDQGCRTCATAADFCTSCPAGSDRWLQVDSGLCLDACPEMHFARVEFPTEVAPGLERICLPCPEGCDRCTPASPAPVCRTAPSGLLLCPEIATCDKCKPGLLLHQGARCLDACPAGFFPDANGSVPACGACHRDCSECVGPGVDDCVGSSSGPSGHPGLTIGLAVGIPLAILLLASVGLCIYLYRRRKSPSGDVPMKPLPRELD
ncbi:hypothetical protein H696_03225 [Fonticula alba]|uniref:EGF-like domain-containing protein n=1 Tax=Fonticula alba TaxID=691883 RepID=A0A058Z9B8_FONAL|nr:hypothetical protein H696_03225 [Fonticula alba]KCV70870.1 hypothetical protein H696_03225 [Fonticula alba]|eukprot:XP_009495386.1 hypothetical protein H696_03225 [Fonticula alba]